MRLVAVCDREADIYELFVAERPAGVDWLVRAAWDRGVVHPQRHLWATMGAAPLLGHAEVRLPPREKSQERLALLAIRCAPVRLRPPRTRARLSEQEVYAVWAREEAAPPGAEPLEWMLLTTLGEAIAWVAQLGGHFGRKHDRPPGPTVLWRGFLALHEITQMYRIFRQNE